MPDRPLILFPSPERADREHKTPVFTKTVRPSFGRQSPYLINQSLFD